VWLYVRAAAVKGLAQRVHRSARKSEMKDAKQAQLARFKHD
jgi:hypothetical protein